MIKNKPFTSAVILAAGSGKRMKSDITKQRIVICGQSVLQRAIQAFERCDLIDEIIVVCKEDEREFVLSEISGTQKFRAVVAGGNCRCESAKLGFQALETKEGSFVLIHDAARCLITSEDISKVAEAAYIHGCATASLGITDTVKEVNGEDKIFRTVPRDYLKTVQTPQAFSCELYQKALAFVGDKFDKITDDNMLLENIGIEVFAVETSKNNIKITTAEDVVYAEFLIKKREKK